MTVADNEHLYSKLEASPGTTLDVPYPVLRYSVLFSSVELSRCDIIRELNTCCALSVKGI